MAEAAWPTARCYQLTDMLDNVGSTNSTSLNFEGIGQKKAQPTERGWTNNRGLKLADAPS